MISNVVSRGTEKWLKERFIRSTYWLFGPIAISGVMAGYYQAQADASDAGFLATMFILLFLDLALAAHVINGAWDRWQRWDRFRRYMRSDIPSLEAKRFVRDVFEEHRQASLPYES